MPFDRMLQSVRRWLQHITGHDAPMYLIVKRNGDLTPLYLEVELDVLGDILAHRWTRNPARATVFKEPQKQRIGDAIPADGFWYPIVELPLHGDPRDPPYRRSDPDA